jgi:hypothetical protein
MDTMLRGVSGVTDLMHAARTEASRVMKETKGDLVAEHEILLGRLVAADLVKGDEAAALLELYKVAVEASRPKGHVARAYFEVQERYDLLAARPSPSPVALAVAGAGLGAFTVEPGSDGAPTIAVYRLSYGSNMAAIGAALGSILGGPAGGALGGLVGGFLGGIIDEKKDDKK